MPQVKKPRSIIALRDVTLRAGEARCFEHTSWEIAPGEQWAILGPNGSGKSFLLHALLGEAPVIAGDIVYGFGGMRRNGTAYPSECRIGYVSLDLHREIVSEAVSYHQARWSPVGEDREPTAAEILERTEPRPSRAGQRSAVHLLGIESLLTRAVSHLSNGEARKVLLARALAQRPKLLMLDDPFTGLDRASRKALKHLLDGLMAEGLPIIVVTQRPDELPRRTSHLMLIENHRIVAQGKRSQIERHPLYKRLASPPKTVPLGDVLPPNAASEPRGALPVVEMHDAHVVYDGAAILQHIDWVIGPGERWALTGPNGSGKTTLLSLILADNPQWYANDIRVFGIDSSAHRSVWDVRKDIGWVAPELQFHYDLSCSCYEVVCSGFFGSIGLYESCSRAQRRRASAWLEALGLQSRAEEPFGVLSDGEQRLALIARALVKDPKLLILDEPCQGLDTVNRERMLSLIRLLAQRPGLTMIYVTHHRDEIPPDLTHELRLRSGRIARRGRRPAQSH